MKFTGVIFLSNSLLTAAFAPGEFQHKCVNYSWLLCVHEMWYGGGLALAACAAPLERIRIIHMANGEHEAIMALRGRCCAFLKKGGEPFASIKSMEY